MDFVRTTPGRLVGQTTDREGNRSFVLTLAAREQHIRREKAVSNICTNSGHCALAAAMYMATAGKTGLRSVAQLNHDKAAYLKAGLEKAGFRPLFSGPFFNEFAMTAPAGFESQREKLVQKGFVAGLELGRYFRESETEYKNAFLFCATEVHTKDVIDAFLQNLKSQQGVA
jgi:glycine dehydrogenase subunit 1